MNSKSKSSSIGFPLIIAATFGGGLGACAGSADAPEGQSSATAGLSEADAPAVAKTTAPLRSLQAPGGVYITSIEHTSSATGNLQHVVHVYQPDGNGEGIRFELAARTSGGAIDAAHGFQSVTVTSRPGETGEITQTLGNANGQRVYALSTSRQGWYRLSFTHVAPSGGRTLTIRAYDTANNPLKLAWSDPPGVDAQVRVGFRVTQTTNAFFKGGAYRNADPASSAFADSVKVNGALLYRRSFDQGRYNFPLGSLNPGQHTLEFSLSSSGGAPKYWFGVNEKSFDPLGGRSAWGPVQFLYYGAMHTGDYDAWNDGVAFAQGPMAEGSRPPPVRRGTTFAVALDDSRLRAGNATIRISSVLSPQTEVAWTKTLPASSDYAGGIFSGGAPVQRGREHWLVSVPSSAPVGRYKLRAFAPDGAQIGTDVLFYVIHNPYPLLGSTAISKAELEAYGYDEDEDGVAMQGPYGTDRDNFRDHFTVLFSAVYQDSLVVGYGPRTKLTGAFRRTGDESRASMLDFAASSMDGTTTELESMLRLYRLVSQRIRYNSPTPIDDTSDYFIGMGAIEPSLAYWSSLPSSDLWDGVTTGGECFEYGTALAALARSAGLLARPISGLSIGGWGNHVFTEAYIPGAGQHGGKRTSSNSSAASDTDPWYTFDATDPNGNGRRSFVQYAEAVAPRAQYGRARQVTTGSSVIDAVTNPPIWDPFATSMFAPSSVLNVTSAYTAGPEYWLTASGVNGWIGYGEKDVYRISKAVTGAKAVRVTTVGGSSSLALKVCVGSVSNTPIMPERCPNAASSTLLPSGESYVVVFNDAEDAPSRYLRGDIAKYVLDLEY